MEDFNSESDSDYTSYWRDWVGEISRFRSVFIVLPLSVVAFVDVYQCLFPCLSP